MPIYVFKCWDCPVSIEVFRKQLAPPSTVTCPNCGRHLEQDYSSKRVQVDAFRPYTEDNLGPEPVQIESRQQREELCARRGVSYESFRYSRPRVRRPVAEGLTDDRMHAILQQGPRSAGPVEPIEGLDDGQEARET